MKGWKKVGKSGEKRQKVATSVESWKKLGNVGKSGYMWEIVEK